MSANHRTKIYAQLWSNVPPYPSRTLSQARCKCGWEGLWWAYEINAKNEAGEHMEQKQRRVETRES